MNFKKTMLAAVVTLGTIAGAQAAGSGAGTPATDQGHGKVTFTGSIIDAPCSIDSKSLDQTVDLGGVSNVSLLNGGNSSPKPFEIHLEKCSLETAKTVTTTFNGAAGKNGLLGMTGDAKGASIAITDGSNNLIELGKATQGQVLSAGGSEATLAFSAYLKGDGGDDKTIVPGKFQSVANFILNYK
ncbi:fimbrial protein [Erwinia persicina]|uniref:Fimbria A protein n=1 Tax=Erwinia persicina TaxID=55211 RepID=A0A3Q8H7N4_9GAMM|nr:fimbrial protein [Erwinia persicina]AXU96063.1 fimbria A protein [Erwinia persicina]MCQ4094532.1 fimbrial protein [Erwinia persicina]MCQ4101246.1 fimbrial protein [Erwinia persicina]MCQ4104949.1 fimbrial protein [Erwinia persicina]QZQ49235.1 fimbrial protein [Erwinia persicina]